MADDTKVNEGHATSLEDEGKLVNANGPDPVAEARRLHHLATADPEPERGDGLLTGPAHEEKHGLERAESSAEIWRASGVHPTENRALVGDEDGAENVRGAAPLETADAKGASENTAAPKAASK